MGPRQHAPVPGAKHQTDSSARPGPERWWGELGLRSLLGQETPMARAHTRPRADQPDPVEPACAEPDAGPPHGGPRLPRVYVPRPRLWERLDSATASAATLLVAPVGAGKTLGVGGWLQHSRAPQATRATWIHADGTWLPERLEAVLDAAASTPDDEAAGPRLVVIDDAHALPAASVRLVDERLNEAPERLRVLLISRWDLPLTRLLPELLGNLTVLRGDLLRMADAQCAALVAEHARTTDPEVVRAVTTHAQGWCAVVVLAARAVGAAPDPVAAAQRLAAGNTAIADRVANEVFAALSPRQRHLLLCVAGEGVVSARFAVHLTHDPRATETLVDLENTGLLVSRVPSDDSSEDPLSTRYRIHPLLVEVIRRRLVAGGVDVSQARATVVRAVHLDLARGVADGAFNRLVGINAQEEAADLLAGEGVRMALSGRGAPEVLEFVRNHPDTIDSRPDTWFAVAMDRWMSDDLERARHWIERIIEHRPGEHEAAQPEEVRACVRLWKARLGLEPMYAAVGYAKRVVVASRSKPSSDDGGASVLPILVSELGIAQNWLGELAEAEASLSIAVGLAQAQGQPALVVPALSHLAFTQFMAGREHTCAEVATEALSRLESADGYRTRHAPSRAALALLLSGLVDLPWPTEPIESTGVGTGTTVHSADLCMRFWLRVRDARLALTAGSVADAERVLATPLEHPQLTEVHLPDHLRSALLVERSFLAALSADRYTLRELESQLTSMDAIGEAELVAGLRADLGGDRRAAVAAFEAAAADVTYSQPPTRALALVCQAQLLDALDQHDEAMEVLAEAATATEVRRNAVPFLGWCRQGTPVETLLRRLDEVTMSPWVHELAAAMLDRPDITSVFAPMTATPRERDSALPSVVRPLLSPREREVLAELARGSTYADIAAALFVSENTVKTHVSSLYGKLAVSRRSEALAVARSQHLL
jgi:LuxR family maltose regulon positive regulatory protein